MTRERVWFDIELDDCEPVRVLIRPSDQIVAESYMKRHQEEPAELPAKVAAVCGWAAMRRLGHYAGTFEEFVDVLAHCSRYEPEDDEQPTEESPDPTQPVSASQP